MQPSQRILDSIATLLAADTNNLGAGTAMHAHLAKNPFTPGPNLVLADFTEATFPGYAAKLAGTGTQTVYTDPASGLSVILIKEPAGGWTWLCTGTPSPAETIYGIYFTDTADAVYLGCLKFTNGIIINANGQAVTQGQCTFTVAANPLT
jgi:hypothetical protein